MSLRRGIFIFIKDLSIIGLFLVITLQGWWALMEGWSKFLVGLALVMMFLAPYEPKIGQSGE